MPWTPTIDAGRGAKAAAILEALAADIRSGRLTPGERLPPQRELAQALGVDLTTVTRAFNEARRLGLIEASVGRGSFVRGPAGPAGRAPRGETAPADAPSSIDLSMNMPPQPRAARLDERLERALAQVLAGPNSLARLNYQETAGTAADRAAGARWLRERLGSLGADRVLVAGGAQAALYAVLAGLLAPGDTLCAPALTYPGLRAAAASRSIPLVSIAMDGQGILPDAFEEACREARPRALYLVPTIDNPTTATLPLDRREQIVEIARRHRVVIVEDDAYGTLAPQAPPPLAALAPELAWHIATLSKCVSPGMRIAYVAAPLGADLHRVVGELRATTQMAPPLLAGIASRWIGDGTLEAIRAAIREESAARQIIAREALGGLDISADPHGHHVWLRLPQRWTRGELGFAARQSGLSVVPSDAFAVGPAIEAVRLALGAAPDRDALRRGLKLVAALLSRVPGALSAVV